MKFAILLTSMLLALPAFAGNSCGNSCSEELKGVTKEQAQCVAKRDCAPQLRKKDKEIAQLKNEVERLKEYVDLLEKERTKLYDKLDYQDRFHKEPIVRIYAVYPEESKKNSLSLIAPITPTKLEVTSNGTDYHAENKYQPEIGLMYQRDFNRFRGTAGIASKGTTILGVGVNF